MIEHNKRKATLAVGAHPDDVEIMCGGTLFLLRDLHCYLHVVTMTLGDCGSTEHSAQEIRRIRQLEARSACAFLNSSYHNLGFGCRVPIHNSGPQGATSRMQRGERRSHAAKRRMITLTKSLAGELGPHNVAVNAIAPGFMRMPMSVMNGVQESGTDFQKWYVGKRHIPMARTGIPKTSQGQPCFRRPNYPRCLTAVVEGGLTTIF
jgi:NAD(P)-dependent dehydrogenase (short-subunit alcohol dehydrogenase family)